MLKIVPIGNDMGQMLSGNCHTLFTFPRYDLSDVINFDEIHWWKSLNEINVNSMHFDEVHFGKIHFDKINFVQT